MNYLQIFRFTVFLSIQIPFIPFAIIGAIFMALKEKKVSKKLGISYVAGQVIQSHWLVHYFNTRPDPLTVAFIKKYPAESHYGFLMLMGPAILANRICGYIPKIAQIPEKNHTSLVSFVNVRTKIINDYFSENVGNVEQIVIMGAGFDLRGLKYCSKNTAKVFEIDLPNTQKVKINTLKKAGIPHEHITYVPSNFNNNSWKSDLKNHGYDPSKKTFFLWESVSPYLEPSVVKDTLKGIKELCSNGSIIVQDFYSQDFIEGKGFFGGKQAVQLMQKVGEPWLFGLDMSVDPKGAVERFLAEASLKIENIDFLGARSTKTKKPFYALVESIINK